MISKQETLNLSPYMALYNLIIPKDNMLRQINELVDFSFILDELKSKYCLDNGRNAIPPIRMFKILLHEIKGIVSNDETSIPLSSISSINISNKLIYSTVEIVST